MKNVYSDLIYQKQIHKAGFCRMEITPREWLASDPVTDFETGQVLQAIPLQSGKFWLTLQMTPKSYEYAETPKDSKSGDFYQISASGLLNTCNAALQQVLETIRRSEVVVILTDKNKRRKLVGDSASGMKLQITHTHKNAPAGEERLQIDLMAEVEGLPPYYNPDNTPDVQGNFLIDSNGNYLLVE